MTVIAWEGPESSPPSYVISQLARVIARHDGYLVETDARWSNYPDEGPGRFLFEISATKYALTPDELIAWRLA